MKVLLIDPPFRRFTEFANIYFPVGLGYLAAALRENGHEARILDVDVLHRTRDIDLSEEYWRLQLFIDALNNNEHSAWRDIENVLADYEPDIIGITAMTMKFGSVLKVAEICKKVFPHKKIIVGGPHATIDPDQVLSSPHIDYAVRGEGERILLNLLQAVTTGGDLNKIKGVSYKQNGEVHHNPAEATIENLDEISLPARDLLIHQQNYTSEDMGVVISYRGCSFRCSYCFHPWGRKVRKRSVGNILLEMKHVMDTYGTRQFDFADDTFTLNRKHTMELCQGIIEARLDVNWACSTRVDLLDEELLKLMKKSGCNLVKVGVETGSEKILKETQKDITFEQIHKSAEMLNNNGLFWSAYFMIGLPTETEEDILATYSFMKELDPCYAALCVYNPMPGTSLFETGVQMGLIDRRMELERFFSTNPKDYYFKDPERRVAFIEPHKFKEISRFMSDAFHRHNTRLRNLARRGWSRRKTYIRDGSLLWSDIQKALAWVMPILKNKGDKE